MPVKPYFTERLEERGDIYTKTIRRSIEVMILLIVIVLGVICLKINYIKCNDALYPKE